MATPAPRRRRSAAPPVSNTVKASLIVSRDLHSRWHAAACLRGVTANAIAVEALTEALRGIIVVDRRKTADPVETEDRPAA
jgi:hypothetical protein